MPRPVPVKPSFQTLRVIVALIMREMTTTYGRSPGGYLWAVLEPTLGIIFLTAVFALITRSPPLGSNFPLFYATGLLPFLLYVEVSNKIGQAIRFSKPLLTYPRVTFLDAVLARLILVLLTNIAVWIIILGGLILFFEARPTLSFRPLLEGMALMTFLGFAVGSINCTVFAFFPIWERIWAIVNRPLMFVSAVFYLVDDFPTEIAQLIAINPLVHAISIFRQGFYPEYHPDFVSYFYILLWCMPLSCAGVFFLHFYHRKIMNEL